MSVRRWILGAALALAAAVAAPAQEKPAPEAPKESPPDQVKRISAVLETMRRKKFKHEVGVETQTQGDFRKWVEAELDEELPRERAAALSKALQALRKGETFLVWRSAWDTGEDAKELADAVAPDGPIDFENVSRAGTEVLVLEGAPAGALERLTAAVCGPVGLQATPLRR